MHGNMNVKPPGIFEVFQLKAPSATSVVDKYS